MYMMRRQGDGWWEVIIRGRVFIDYFDGLYFKGGPCFCVFFIVDV